MEQLWISIDATGLAARRHSARPGKTETNRIAGFIAVC